MALLPLTIVTPDGCIFEGEVKGVVCRCMTGDIAILANHCDMVTALGMGEAHVNFEDGSTRKAACIGGMLSVIDGVCRLVPTTWEWADEIDLERAEAAKKRNEELLKQKHLDEREYELALAHLRRALVRTSVAK